MAERQTLKMFCFLENLYFGWWQLITLPVLQINLVLTFPKENCAYLHSDAFSIKRSNKSCLQSPAEEIEEISFWQNFQKAENQTTQKMIITFKKYFTIVVSLCSCNVKFLFQIKKYFLEFAPIPDNCYGHHGRCPCKNILSGVKFFRLNAKTAYNILFQGHFQCFGVFLIIFWV